MALSDTCKNCGHEKGTHRATDHACSKLTQPERADHQTPQWSLQYRFEPVTPDPKLPPLMKYRETAHSGYYIINANMDDLTEAQAAGVLERVAMHEALVESAKRAHRTLDMRVKAGSASTEELNDWVFIGSTLAKAQSTEAEK